MSGKGATPEVGNALYLADIPLGTLFIILSYVLVKEQLWHVVLVLTLSLAARDGKYATIKMPSGETRMIFVTCMQLLVLYLMLIITKKLVVKQVVLVG
jgi:large subunit ribosomal protein L2